MADSTQIRALPGGDAALAAIDAALAELRTEVKLALVEQIASGHLDATAAVVEGVLAHFAREARTPLKRLVFVAHMAARDYGTPAAAHEAPTVEIEQCPRCHQPVARPRAR